MPFGPGDEWGGAGIIQHLLEEAAGASGLSQLRRAQSPAAFVHPGSLASTCV